MKVQAKGRVRDQYEGRNYLLEDGDIATVPDTLGANWIANGWAKNFDTGEDNAPSRDPVTLDVANARHTHKAEV